jgi:lysozyme
VSRGIRILIRLGATALAMTTLVAVVIVLGRAGSPNPNPSPSPDAVYIPGADVSSHEHGISWSGAARFGLRFVIARASEGDSRVDSAYRATRQEADAAGLAFTAFHYARPDRAAGDAIREADFFLSKAGLVAGDLPPVLDIEESGGLGPVRLQAWATAWLQEVTAKLGVKPMIYTNSDFWVSRMGDTTVFADAGYPLFVASWGATTPLLPAGYWGGRGWTMWQTAKCGKVRGIKGCIRTDLFNGGDLEALAIPP